MKRRADTDVGPSFLGGGFEFEEGGAPRVKRAMQSDDACDTDENVHP